ncbi:hypothetical protein R1sor_002829 [Riccia sorocarpa]|uniref:CCHC-type domain-containing protein n=1 Tax=Riccia sorocarpa TaxID=122646 RepID=A0ABD3H2J5_9MARC
MQMPPVRSKPREISREEENLGKRTRSDRLSLLRRSVDLEDFGKRHCSTQHGDHMESQGHLARSSTRERSRSRGSTPNTSPTPRRDLFGVPSPNKDGRNPVRIRSNLAFESSPRADPFQQHRRTPNVAHTGTSRTLNERSRQSQPWQQGSRLPGVMTQPANFGSTRDPTRVGVSHNRGWETVPPPQPVAPAVIDSQGERNTSPQQQIHQANPAGDVNIETEEQWGQQVGSRSSSPHYYSQGVRRKSVDSWGAAPEEDMCENQEAGSELHLSERDELGEDEDKREEEKWKNRVIDEVTTAFKKIPDRLVEATEGEVELTLTFDFDAQVRIQAEKRKWEDCGLVFCTIDMTPSRDVFARWIYQEVENKAAVHVQHIRILAPRHYLVLLRSMEDRDAVLTNGPYYMRRRMIYTSMWEPGFDTSKALAKKMCCWLDIQNVDPMLAGEGLNMLSSIGEVLRTAGTTKEGDGKFAHIRGCVLIDMSKPIPTVLKVVLNGETKRFGIHFDTLPDACFLCQERGHFARNCPANRSGAHNLDKNQQDADEEGFQEVLPRRPPVVGSRNRPQEEATSSNPYQVLEQVQEGEEEVQDNSKSTEATMAEQDSYDNPEGVSKTPNLEQEPATSEGGETRTEHLQLAADENLPDLNITPATTTQTTSETGTRSLTRKEKRKAKKREARARKGRLVEVPTNTIEEVEEREDPDEDNTSDSEEKGFWQTTKPKHTRREETVAGAEGSDDKVRAVKRWIETEGRGVTVMGIQELKAGERVLEYNIRRLIQDATCIMDYSSSDRGGAGLIIPPSVTVKESGICGNGTAAWVRAVVGGEEIGFMSIYCPHEVEEKRSLFSWLSNFSHVGRWCMMGDWNLVLLPEDTMGPTALLKGGLLQAWMAMDQIWDLQDVYLAAEQLDVTELSTMGRKRHRTIFQL